jgi:DNA polymerase-3 subunit alpha
MDNLFGAVKFYSAARKRGLKPIIGCDVAVYTPGGKVPSRLLLLVQDKDGYLKLSRWLTRAYVGEERETRAAIHSDWIQAEGSHGLIALSGWKDGDVERSLMDDDPQEGARKIKYWSDLFEGRFYLEIQRSNKDGNSVLEASVLRLAEQEKIPVVATHPVEFLNPTEFMAHEARYCISEGFLLADQNRSRPFNEEQYFKSQAQMKELFSDLPGVIDNTIEIAKRCSLEFDLGNPQLPNFPTPPGMSLEQFLAHESAAGLDKRMAHLARVDSESVVDLEVYRDRLKFEIDTIVDMGFAGYFLIVADFINWAKNNDVPVGPGRGSGAGSLVAFALGITDLDPIQYNLLFERFLNPERVSMPDFDIDFCQVGRDRVIDYVREKYGTDSVSQIVTFGTMAAKAVVRDVARVMEWSYGRADELAKLIPFQPGKLITLDLAREMEPRLKEKEDSDEETRELLALARQLEGVTRNVGMHAGGVLIAPSALSDFCPLYSADGSHSVISQLDKDDVEHIGLVKFDFLGLTTLTVIDWTLKFIRRLDPEKVIDLAALPLDDPLAYRIFSSGNTAAVFQFESRGMRDLIERAQPDRFEDIVALVALFRPGPMDLIPDFVERKHGRQQVNFPDDRVKAILEETYGIMVYQEQVMQMAQIIGGYSLGGADLLRRAMGKKKPEEMAQHRQLFLEGSKKNGLTEKKSNEIFDLMEKFAGYGFNKSHAAAYALIAYQTAWFKCHHMAAFMAANMSASMDDTDRIQHLYTDCIKNNIELLPPDIHESEYRFFPASGSQIRYGLGGIRGTGEAAIEHILHVRSQGSFTSFFDFCCRIDRHIVNKRSVESLVKAGAFDTLDSNRARLLKSVQTAMMAAEQLERDLSQRGLFDDDVVSVSDVAITEARAWAEYEQLQNEKVALGFYYSGHPFKSFEQELTLVASTRLNAISIPAPEEGIRQTLLAGVVDSARIQKTNNGRMMIVTISDGYGSEEVVLYDEFIDQFRDLVKEDRIVVFEAKIRSYRRGSDTNEASIVSRIAAENVFSLAAVRERFGKTLKLRMGQSADATQLKQILTRYRNGVIPVTVMYQGPSGEAEIDLGEEWRVTPEDALFSELRDWLSPEGVSLKY